MNKKMLNDEYCRFCMMLLLASGELQQIGTKRCVTNEQMRGFKENLPEHLWDTFLGFWEKFILDFSYKGIKLIKFNEINSHLSYYTDCLILWCIKNDNVYERYLRECLKKCLSDVDRKYDNLKDVWRLFRDAKVFVEALSTLYSLNLSHHKFKRLLAFMLKAALSGICETLLEYPVEKGIRIDLVVKCDEFIVAFEVKTQNDLKIYASANIIAQLEANARALLKRFDDKRIALILTTTSGTSKDLAKVLITALQPQRALAMSWEILSNSRFSLHAWTRENIRKLFRDASQLSYSRKAIWTYEFLRLHVDGVVDSLGYLIG